MAEPHATRIAQAAPPPPAQPTLPAAPAPSSASRARVTVPASIKPNTTIEIRTVITHVMETGLRRDAEGKVIPRHIVNAMSVLYRNKSVFSADLNASTSANPYIAFWLKVIEPGPLVVTWTDDTGKTVSETVDIVFA
jgi:sulfur-oxidizing protein SoxZ